MGTKELIMEVEITCLRTGTFKDKTTIKILGKVDRAKFIPESNVADAYKDEPVPIGFAQTCSQPSLVGIMIELLELKPGLNVFEAGTGCGYHAAIVYEKMNRQGRIVTVERKSEIYALGKANLDEYFGEGKIEVIHSNGYRGHPAGAPYDRMYFTAAPNILYFDVNILLDQLADDGILLFPERFYNKLVSYRVRDTPFDPESIPEQLRERLVPITSKGRLFTPEVHCDVNFVPLIDKEG